MQQDPNKNPNPNPNPKKLASMIPYLVVAAFLIAMLFSTPLNNSTSQQLTYKQFEELLDSEEIKSAKVTVDYNTISVTGTFTQNGSTYSFSTLILNSENGNDEMMEKLKKVDDVKIVDANASTVWSTIISSILPIVAFGAIGIFMLNRMTNGIGSSNKQAFDFSKSRARLEKDIRIKFDDVAGCDEEKEEMAEIIDYLKSPRKFAKLGARIPKGILLVGPPGTGKTLLAKAVAGEADVPFYSISGSDFVEMFVGVGASRVRDMFKTAKANAPCMIFIDEIDAVGRQRGAGIGGGHDEREQTLNQMLVEMDGMQDNAGIIVIAATNRPDVLDPALLRPGRFDREITVSLPDLKGREAILKVHARNKQLAEGVDLAALARRTPGFSGADLENVLNEAAILTVRHNQEKISLEDIDEAIDRVMMGPAKKSRTYDGHTKKLVAYHEAGHAIVGLNLPDGSIVQKVTIIPRGNAGGYNLITPRKEKILNSRKELIDTITSYMGGRAAEELFFDDITTGASGDIQSATRIAKDMVTTYGMSALGPVQYDSGNGNVFLGRDYNSPSNASSQIAYEIDVEVRKIIDECHENAKKIITRHKKELIAIAEALIANETLTAEEIQDVIDGKLVVKDGRLVSSLTGEEIPEVNKKTKVEEIKALEVKTGESAETKPKTRKPRKKKAETEEE